VRVGILDIVAAGAFVVAAALPSPSRPIKPLYVREAAALGPTVGEAQAEVAHDPKSGAAVAKLADLLVRARQTDWAIRTAAAASTIDSPDRWRVLVAASAAHVDRLEIRQGLEWAEKALAACEAPGADCADFERARLALYERALRAAFDSHIDPKRNAKGFIDAVDRAAPLIRLGKPG
jgi:hypothetical protein